MALLDHPVVPVFDAAREHDVDRLVMGHGGTKLAGGRVEGGGSTN
jgi:hypothetical protein